MPPTRVLDTRTAKGGTPGPVASKTHVPLIVAGVAGVPSTGVSAVVASVTVITPTASGYLQAAPSGSSTSETIVNYTAKQSISSMAVLPVGANNAVVLTPSGGSVQLAVDVVGYFVGGAASTNAGSYTSIASTRALDTRSGKGGTSGVVRTKQIVPLTVTGVGGVPAQGVSAVLAAVTVMTPGATGYLQAAARGSSSTATIVNYSKKQSISTLAVLPVGTDGVVDLTPQGGTAQLAVDLVGYVIGGSPTTLGALGVLTKPSRLLDTRYGTGGPTGPIASHKAVPITVTGRDGVPAQGVSTVVAAVTVMSPTASGYLQVAGRGSSAKATVINYTKGHSISTLVDLPVGTGGVVGLTPSGGTVQLAVDIQGYYQGSAVPLYTSHYIRTSATDTTTLNNLGKADATAGDKLVVLDIGAQINDVAPSTSDTFGVELSATATQANPAGTTLTYAQLVTLLTAYFTGFESVTGASGTVAVATNNDADPADAAWTNYTAQQRGIDWYTQVVKQLQTVVAATPAITVVGANDIESGFGTTKATDAQTWEQSYLAAGSGQKLVFIGAASGCPTETGSTAACNNGWTQSELYGLAGGGSSQILALPQVYNSDQAAQWANIDANNGKAIDFVGALTESQACAEDTSTPPCTSYTPEQGYAALWNALEAVGVTPPSQVTDLDIVTSPTT